MENENKVGRGRPRKENSNEFEPIIIKFDDVSFNEEIEDQNETLYVFTLRVDVRKNQSHKEGA